MRNLLPFGRASGPAPLSSRCARCGAPISAEASHAGHLSRSPERPVTVSSRSSGRNCSDRCSTFPASAGSRRLPAASAARVGSTPPESASASGCPCASALGSAPFDVPISSILPPSAAPLVGEHGTSTGWAARGLKLRRQFAVALFSDRQLLGGRGVATGATRVEGDRVGERAK